MDFLSELKQSLNQGLLIEKYYHLLLQFYTSYQEAIKTHHIDKSLSDSIFCTFLKLVEKQTQIPFLFAPYHKQILTPFNHYKFGLDFFKPLIDIESSSLKGDDPLHEITRKLEAKENVIFLANHQIEADPQVIGLLLGEKYPLLASKLIFVAGERVITDPLAIPFSMGCNLLCIYSKKYIDHPPELKTSKQLHNKKTMELMGQLLSEGGHAIYVAPSGGRDRADKSGNVAVAPFDPQSIEMFYLMTKKSSKPTSFYPMALYTYDLLPPPEGIQLELGETRQTKRGKVHLSIGPQIPMENIPGLDESDKRKRREIRAHYIWNEVCKEYSTFPISKY
jgi:glycerol-3-phosphate O-acyltransferase